MHRDFCQHRLNFLASGFIYFLWLLGLESHKKNLKNISHFCNLRFRQGVQENKYKMMEKAMRAMHWTKVRSLWTSHCRHILTHVYIHVYIYIYIYIYYAYTYLQINIYIYIEYTYISCIFSSRFFEAFGCICRCISLYFARILTLRKK